MEGLPKEGRAVTLDANTGKVEMRMLPVVPPKAGQVLVRVRRANVCGSDLHMVRGEAFASYKPHYPIILGHEMVGEILAMGDGISRDSRGNRLKPGDRVTYAYHRGCGGCPVCAADQSHVCLQALTSVIQDCNKAPHFSGAFADYYMIKEGQAIVKVPDSVPDSLAAGCNCALAQVIHGLDTVGVGMGDQVVIQGAGGLGLYATAVAKARGAKQVIVIDAHDSRLELAKAFGADRVISLQQVPDKKMRVMQVVQATGGGAQVVVEVVGRAEALKEGQRMLQRGGRYLVMGCIVPRDTFTADPSIWVGANLTLHAVSLYPTQALINAMDFVEAHADKLPLEAMVAETYSLDDFEAAIEAADALGKSPNAARVALQIA